MDGLELALKCSSLLMRTMNKLQGAASTPTGGQMPPLLIDDEHLQTTPDDIQDATSLLQQDKDNSLSDTEAEKHFTEAGTTTNFALDLH